MAAKQKHDLGFQKRQDSLKGKRERAKKQKRPCMTLDWCRGKGHPFSCKAEECPDNLTDMRVNRGRR